MAASLGTEAHADCLQGQYTFTSCQIEGGKKEVFVCYDDQQASYSYGPIGGVPDLFLSEAIENIDFEPWDGLGEVIRENVTFYNGDYSYEVGAGFDRSFSEEEILLGNRQFGWLEVARNGEISSKLECIPETVTYSFSFRGGIYDAKVTAGLKWDSASMTWLPDPNHPTVPPARAPVLMRDTRLFGFADCLPFTEFKLGGIMMDDPATTLGELGPPVAREAITNGIHDHVRFTYDDSHVLTFRGVVAEIYTTTPQWAMPSGIKVGLTRGEVISILGRAPNGVPATTERLGASVCSYSHDQGHTEWYLDIEFGQNKRVQSIRLGSEALER